jgi:N-acetylmuramoyl-L-alanine amidase
VRAPVTRLRFKIPIAGLLTGLLLLGWPTGLRAQASAGHDETVVLAGREYSVDVNRRHGYPAFRWTGAPEDLFHRAAVTGGRGTAATSWGGGVEVRAGAPFARVGDVALPMLNPPYVSEGELWVPLELLARAAASRPASSVESGPQVAASGSSEPPPGPPRRRTGPWRVTIDPGHGGHDPGTVNPRTGAREKDIVLAVGKYLRDELRDRPGIEADLTRDEDRFIKLEERPRQALNNGADLFLSIHVNAEPGRGTTARGFETYYLGPKRDDESARVARLENSVLELEGEDAGFGDDTPVDFIISGIVLDDNRGTSGKLGGYVQNSMRGIAVGPDRGTKPGPFWVLVGATGHMPAVLVELGFITNAEDERRLTSERYQKQLASALAEAVESYLEYYDGAQYRLGGAR